MMFPLENNAEKSVKNFKTKIQAKACTITKRSHNLDDDLITQVNRIVRGTANYFTLRKTKSWRTDVRTGACPPLRSRREALIYFATAVSNNRDLFRRLNGFGCVSLHSVQAKMENR
uniref:Group II intron, maturase-specific domain n=2 Tax=Candidatus Kentrum sp. LPFa TaxID=2126335 RepID=A0A450WYH5_9GAMM|nr:MAG: Group II intron, maturase-specific domain [Candidatus Kentron sp. LPFa]VFK24826.1 MAG: Group II intron, maturase-specific domain [Candidatus Kentron sp. LPFa]VFK25032.1 MAG: Group II intron, maturase-specific domain [Candidatus Kentron sp. LPFa]